MSRERHIHLIRAADIEHIELMCEDCEFLESSSEKADLVKFINMAKEHAVEDKHQYVKLQIFFGVTERVAPPRKRGKT